MKIELFDKVLILQMSITRGQPKLICLLYTAADTYIYDYKEPISINSPGNHRILVSVLIAVVLSVGRGAVYRQNEDNGKPELTRIRF